MKYNVTLTYNIDRREQAVTIQVEAKDDRDLMLKMTDGFDRLFNPTKKRLQ